MLNKSCVVFDLDDTLYYEADYQCSGYEAIAKLVEQTFGINVRDEIQGAHRSGYDVLDCVCRLTKQPLSFKESLIWCYRIHQPNIALSPSVLSTLDYIKSNALYCAILTDGRSVSQRLKINALGLSEWEVFISEEWGKPKPDRTRFEYIMNNVDASQYIYVGDNPNKDFISPNQLGWITVGVRDNGRNVHPQKKMLLNQYNPKYWIDNLHQLKMIL